MEQITIYYMDQKTEKEQLNEIMCLAEGRYDIHLTQGNIHMINNGFYFPVIELNHRFYGYREALDLLKEQEDT